MKFIAVILTFILVSNLHAQKLENVSVYSSMNMNDRKELKVSRTGISGRFILQDKLGFNIHTNFKSTHSQYYSLIEHKTTYDGFSIFRENRDEIIINDTLRMEFRTTSLNQEIKRLELGITFDYEFYKTEKISLLFGAGGYANFLLHFKYEAIKYGVIYTTTQPPFYVSTDPGPYFRNSESGKFKYLEIQHSIYVQAAFKITDQLKWTTSIHYLDDTYGELLLFQTGFQYHLKPKQEVNHLP